MPGRLLLAPRGSAAPTPCPADTFSFSTGLNATNECKFCAVPVSLRSPSLTECTCKPGLFLQNKACVTCSFVGVICTKAHIKVEALPLEPGYWRVSANSTNVVACYTDGVCIGAAAAQERSDAARRRRLQEGNATSVLDSTSTYGDGLCRTGHVGAFCEVCMANHYRDYTGLCTNCEASEGNVNILLSLPIVVVVLLLVVGLGFVCKGRKKAIQDIIADKANDAKEGGKELDLEYRDHLNAHWAAVRGKIFLSLVQVLTQIGTVFEIRLPSVYDNIIRWVGVLQIDLITVMPLDCLLPTNFHTTLLLRTLVPIAIMGILGTSGFWAMKRANKLKDASWEWLGNRLITRLLCPLPHLPVDLIQDLCHLPVQDA